MDKQIGGVLYTADFANCDNREIARADEYFMSALKVAYANVIPGTDVFHRFPNGALSGSVLLQESHAAIHTWPEGNFVTFEFFTCGDSNVGEAIRYLADKLKCIKYNTNRHSRFPENAHIPR